MSFNPKLATEVHHWLVAEGRGCHSQADLDSAVDRFLVRWPRIKSDVLQYVSRMLSAELHPRTFKPSRILEGVRGRMADSPPLRRRWWQLGWG
jgi:hypothetical protein